MSATAPSPQAISAALDQIIDPELGRSLTQLGLIRQIDIEGGAVHIDLQLTSPSCPYADEFIARIKKNVQTVAGVNEVEVELVWS